MHMRSFNIKIRIVTTSDVFTTCHTGIGKGKKNCLAFLLLHVSFQQFLFIKFTLRSNFELNFMFFSIFLNILASFINRSFENFYIVS